MKYLDRKSALGTLLKTEVVEVPEWGGQVVIKELSAEDAFLVSEIEFKSTAQKTATYVVLSAYNGEDERIFTMDDVDALAHGSFNVLNRLCSLAMKLSGLAASDENEAETPGN